jgi:hypothetical protein
MNASRERERERGALYLLRVPLSSPLLLLLLSSLSLTDAVLLSLSRVQKTTLYATSYMIDTVTEIPVDSLL